VGISPSDPNIRRAVERGLIPADAVKGATLPALPFPPTVNTYWRRVGNRTLLSERAREYRASVLSALALHRHPRLLGGVEVVITFHPPDRRKRDLDNLPKGLLDALKYAGVYADDSQVRRIDMSFGAVRKGGAALVTVRELCDC
jgi:crossover junction endodeoxyribonuclease RusA